MENNDRYSAILPRVRIGYGVQVYDSTQDTQDHIKKVQDLLHEVQVRIAERSISHDASKLREPEKSVYEKFVLTVREIEKEFGYGSPEYMAYVKSDDVQEFNKLHFGANRHHPEHFENGVNEMTLVDLVEMLCDWQASASRSGHRVNLDANKKRFKLSDQLYEIFQNTAKELGW